jgi:large repetitive protein
MKRAMPLVLALMLVVAGCASHNRASSTPGTAPASGNSNAAEISARGPGMRREAADSIKLPVAPTLDLTHVDPANFAAGLGNDPVRIFNYVRDDIAYEAYAGCLRGPRGTLMAMAGNSLDRASLLASMLQAAGQRVRFAQGTLPESQATELVTSMWAERPAPASAPVQGEPAASIKTASDVLSNGVQSDYTLIRDRLKDANLKVALESAPSLDSMVKETQVHYWVQWFKDGAWVDLDPSFSDSSPGGTYASAAQTFDALPDAVFHQVEIHIRLEEYTGSQVSSRVILSRSAKASDLSGVDVVLSHEPENWQGPAESLEAGLASGITATGRVKPVLFVGGSFVTGEPFYQKGPPTGGTGGVFSQLSGAGTRHAVPIATAESIEFDFIAPDGGKTKVVRDLFDLIGPARRAAGKDLTAEEAQAKIQANASDVTESIYDLFVSTGRIDSSHLSAAVAADDPVEQADDAVTTLRRVNTAFAAISDALLPRLSTPDKNVVLFYPDSPRLQIVDLSEVAGKARLSLDLRWDHVRSAVLGPHPEDVFSAQSFRGVADGVLERVLIDYLTAGNAAFEPEASRLSTSLLFERMGAEGVKAVLLSREDAAFGGGMSEDARARLNQEFGQGFLVLAPERPIALGGQPRFAWWRIDPRSGEVTAVTEEGLNDAALEYKAVVSRNTRGQIYGVRFFRYLPGFSGTALFTGLTQSQFLELIRDLAALGTKFSTLLR